MFKTGWTRKARDANGNLVKYVKKAGEGDAGAGAAVAGEVLSEAGDAITKATKVTST